MPPWAIKNIVHATPTITAWRFCFTSVSAMPVGQCARKRGNERLTTGRSCTKLHEDRAAPDGIVALIKDQRLASKLLLPAYVPIQGDLHGIRAKQATEHRTS